MTYHRMQVQPAGSFGTLVEDLKEIIAIAHDSTPADSDLARMLEMAEFLTVKLADQYLAALRTQAPPIVELRLPSNP